MTYKRKMICFNILLLLFIPFTFTGCKTEDTALTTSDVKEPLSNWEQRPAGSAAYLDGDTVLVSIYLENEDSEWTKAKKKLVKSNLKIACDFLKAEGRRYGKNVNLIFDIDEHPDLEYHCTVKSAVPSNMSDDESEETAPEVSMLYDEISAYLLSKIDVENILSAYNVNSIGFLVFIDNAANAALTFSYHLDKDMRQYYEACLISLRWSKSNANVSPCTYAHEILHLFGARDLYYTDPANGMTKECIDYMYEIYPHDIMLGPSQKAVDWHNRISGEVSDITAYFLGWIDTIYETELFPKIKAQHKAAFTNQEIPEDFKKEYTPGRRKSEKTFFYTLILAAIIFCFFVYSLVMLIITEKLRREQEGK